MTTFVLASLALAALALAFLLPPLWRQARGTALVLAVALPWDPLESTCRHASLSIL